MTKILLGVIAALIVALGVSGWFLKHEIGKAASLQTAFNTSQTYVKQLNKELADKATIDKITDKAVDEVHVQDLAVDTKISTIEETVETTSKKEAKGEITPATASSIYVDSMWRAYCEADIPNPHCSPR